MQLLRTDHDPEHMDGEFVGSALFMAAMLAVVAAVLVAMFLR